MHTKKIAQKCYGVQSVDMTLFLRLYVLMLVFYMTEFWNSSNYLELNKNWQQVYYLC